MSSIKVNGFVVLIAQQQHIRTRKIAFKLLILLFSSIEPVTQLMMLTTLICIHESRLTSINSFCLENRKDTKLSGIREWLFGSVAIALSRVNKHFRFLFSALTVIYATG